MAIGTLKVFDFVAYISKSISVFPIDYVYVTVTCNKVQCVSRP